jgi:GNAT superfamily N-acetyltransferase
MISGAGEVVVATEADFMPWRALAAEVEPLFGPLVGDPSFEGALARCIARGDALCLREGAEGSPLLGGLLFSRKPPVYTLAWLAVAARGRRRGVGRLLVLHSLSLVLPPAEVVVTTFGPDIPEGEPARRFYEAMGFLPGEPAPDGPDGTTHRIYRLRVPA